MEIQMADFRYNPEAKDSELTGGIYRAIAPTKQVYKPTEWNKYQITLKGDHAEALGYMQIVRRDGEGYSFWRVSANRWEFSRIDGR